MAIHTKKYDFNFKANIDSEEMFDSLAKKLTDIEKDGCDDVYFLECTYDGMVAIIEVKADISKIDECVSEFVISLIESEEEDESEDNETESETDESDSDNSEYEDEDEENETNTRYVYPSLPITLIRSEGVSDDDYKEAALLFELMTAKINDLAFDEPDDVISLTKDILLLDNMIKAKECCYDEYGQYVFDLTRELCREVKNKTA